jgi:CubicO group peptidase (beta-lactamase class C family)
MTDEDLQVRSVAFPHGVQGAADPSFSCLVRGFAQLFPWRRLGGGALAVYLNGEPVVDVWTGFCDRAGQTFWSSDTGAMVFSATKGMAATVIHRLVDRGLVAYDAPVAEYWPAFGASGKSGITVRDLLAHRAGLSQLHGIGLPEVLDHRLMEDKLAAQPSGWATGAPAYHAVTFGWLLSGLARAVTGMGMADLIRVELAEPLNTDGLHLGRPPIGASTQPAEILFPQRPSPGPLINLVIAMMANCPLAPGFGSVYFRGARSAVQGDMPILDTEMPSVNGVATARGLAKMYGAIANGGRIDGAEFLSPSTVAGLTGRRLLSPDRNLVIPLGFHMGYHTVPVPAVMTGFGHVGLAGSFGWADPATGVGFSFVHNRLLTPMLLDQATFVALAALVRRGVALARQNGFEPVAPFGAPYLEPRPAAG